MLGRIETALRRLARKSSRTHWLMRLLHLSTSEGPPTRPGLVLLQVDGLSMKQFRRAVDRGEMPFLARLIDREHYEAHSLYSGLPSSTPAVQAELQYGVRTAVPAFSFLDRSLGEIVRMYEPEAALRVEEAAVEQARREGAAGPLCEGGSSYSNVFKGGADIDEAHFCASSLGWGSALRAANPLALLFLIVSNINSVIRILVLLALESVLAVIDFFRGLYEDRSFVKELKFIPTRVAICIALRELCVIGGKMDIHRGLPIIHINFLGYDEQSHRRGPDSEFAHWTLKGIDDSIKRLWHTARTAQHRHYEVWVYSDHGQSEAAQYAAAQGYDLHEAVDRVFEHMIARPQGPRPSSAGVENQRARLLGGRRAPTISAVAAEGDVHVTGLGPIGCVYFPGALDEAELERAARELVQQHGVPVVVTGRGGDQLRAWTDRGEFLIPQQAADLFGADHPFIDELGDDLARLCRHVHAGDLTLLGWHKDVKQPVTFASENGSHAGLTPDETEAFVLVPDDAPLPETSRGHFRPLDLRQAALRHLGRAEPRPEQAPIRRRRGDDPATEQLRIMTYNVHSCVGIDGKLTASRIARVIARAHPDVVALQELDVGRARTGSEDQAELIARHLMMDYHFHPIIHLEEERYGDAILTHLPMQVVRAAGLPGQVPGGKMEPRGALWVAVDLHGTRVDVINTHLGLTSRERLLQVEALLGPDWLGGITDGAVILCGDFNAGPRSYAYRRLRTRLRDAQTLLPDHRPACTFYSRVPSLRIDHVFVDPSLSVDGISVPRSELATAASDHLPLIVDLSIPVRVGGRPAAVGEVRHPRSALGAED